MGPGGQKRAQVSGQGAGSRGHRTALCDTESRLVKDHLRQLTSKGTPGVDGVVAPPANDSAAAAAFDQQQVKGWGEVSLTGGKIGKAEIDSESENEDPDSTSVRVRAFPPALPLFLPSLQDNRVPDGQLTSPYLASFHLISLYLSISPSRSLLAPFVNAHGRCRSVITEVRPEPCSHGH